MIVCKWEKKKDRRHWDTEKRNGDKDRKRNFDRRRATMRLIKTQIREETYIYILTEGNGGRIGHYQTNIIIEA